jgi:hypothetical protein
MAGFLSANLRRVAGLEQGERRESEFLPNGILNVYLLLFRRTVLANTHSRPLVPNGHLPHRWLPLWTANNRKKDRTTIEETIRRLIQLVNSLDEEQKRAAKEGLSEDELALFDLPRSASNIVCGSNELRRIEHSRLSCASPAVRAR